MGPSTDQLFWENIGRRQLDIVVQVQHAISNDVSNVIKSGYYRAAIILACTIVEGLLYKFVEEQVPTSGVIGEVVSYKKPHHIPAEYSDKKLVLVELSKQPIKLSSKTTFNELIKLCASQDWLRHSERKQLEWVMQLRNRIHVQSLQTKDRGYTKDKLDKVFDVISMLIKRMELTTHPISPNN